MAPIFQNLTCAPYTPVSTPCTLGNLAVYAINVTCASDVVAGLKFAREKNIRISIKNTGHEYDTLPFFFYRITVYFIRPFQGAH